MPTAFAASATLSYLAIITPSLSNCATGLAVLTGAGAGIGIGIATSKAADAIANQPEAKGDINKALLLGCALAEATAIYGFVMAIMIIGKA